VLIGARSSRYHAAECEKLSRALYCCLCEGGGSNDTIPDVQACDAAQLPSCNCGAPRLSGRRQVFRPSGGAAPAPPCGSQSPRDPGPLFDPPSGGSSCRAARVLNCQRFGESSRISAKPGSRRCPPSLSRKCRDLLGLAASCLNITGFCRRLPAAREWLRALPSNQLGADRRPRNANPPERGACIA